MDRDALEAVWKRNVFYYNSYRKVMIALLLTILGIILFASILWYLIEYPTMPRYFPITPTGQPRVEVPLTQPGISDDGLLKWAQSAGIAAFTYDFLNYRRQIQAGVDFFSAYGWSEFTRNLLSSNDLKAVQANSFTVSAEPIAVPKLLHKAVYKDKYFWQVELKLLVTYQNRVGNIVQTPVRVIMLIQRLPLLNSRTGLGIEQFVVSPILSKQNSAGSTG